MLKKTRIGFDLDGVILYNPIRIIRPIVAFAKKIFVRKADVFTYYPKTKFERFLWMLAHKTSFFVSPGFKKIIALSKDKNIEIYLITSRFSFLKNDLENWLRKINSHMIFKQCFYNEKDERAHFYKERLIKQLDLDFFVEDNLDIVNHLNKSTKTKVLWIYNVLDRKINYPFKFPNLNHAVSEIEQNLRKKKVLIVTDYFYPHWTGLSKSLFNLTKSLEDHFNLTVLTVRYGSGLKKQENIGKVKIVRANPLFSFSRVKYSLSLIGKSISLLKHNDIVLVNSPFSNILPLSILSKIYRKKLVIFHQGDLVLPRGLINGIIEKAFDISTKISLVLADKAATYSRDYAENSRILSGFFDKFTPLLLPINLTKRNSPAKIKKLEKLKKDKIIFGFAGRFVEEKGFDILFRAVPQIVREIPNAHFVFAGEKYMGYENFFEKNKPAFADARKWITLLGLLNENEMAGFYKKLDYLIVPSRSDCFNYVQAEAMLCGVPSITSDIPGARWLVKKTGFGTLFQSQNPQDLAQAVLTTVKNRENILKNYDKVLKILNNDEISQRINGLIGS